MVAAEKVVKLMEKLLATDKTKDIEIEMSDGKVEAHSNILIAGSPAVEGMLDHGITASAEKKRLSWKEHSVDVGRFFLRLLYTGTVDEAEWRNTSDAGLCHEVPPVLEIESPNGQSEYAGRYKLVHDERPNDKPLWKQVGKSLYLYYFPPKWNLSNLSSKREGFQSAKGFICSVSCSCMPNVATDWMRYDTTRDDLWIKDSSIRVLEPEPRIPLSLLLGSLAIAKMYLFADILEELVEALQSRVALETLDAIFKAAIKTDTLPLRYHCLQYAKDPNHGVQKLYDSDQLSPEVKAELIGTWGPAAPPVKRRKLLTSDQPT